MSNDYQSRSLPLYIRSLLILLAFSAQRAKASKLSSAGSSIQQYVSALRVCVVQHPSFPVASNQSRRRSCVHFLAACERLALFASGIRRASGISFYVPIH